MGNITKQANTRFSIVKRSKGQSAVEKASYISRSILASEYDGQTYRPKYHEDLVHSEITLPPNAPKEYADRSALWNAVELSEKGQKSQLARMLKASLPNDWSYELAEEVVRDYVQRNFVDKGMCADWAIHDSENDKGQRNLHIHVLLTMRPIMENGEWGAKSKKVFDLDENGERIPVIDKKTGQQKVDRRNRKQWKCHTEDSTDWNSRENAKKWRKDLADTINAANALERKGIQTFLSGRLAEECAVLLQNDGILPLDQNSRVVFIGEYAEKPRYQGSGSSHINVPHPVGACETAPEIPYARGFDVHSDIPDEAMIEEAVRLAREAEIAVLFVGQSDAYESEGADRMTMELPANQNALVEAVASVQPNMVVVLHGGAAVLFPWADKVRAVLQMHLGGERTGEAAVRLLFGKANPSGKLAETWPLRLEDNPSYLNFPGFNGEVEYWEGIYIGYRYYDKKKLAVKYPFGHGLSYTEFTYDELALEKDSVTEGEVVNVTCKVRNSGNIAGAEVVQLYIGETNPGVARPVRELKGFEKVFLAPGEEKTVSFSLDSRSFAYYEPRIHDWFVESGKYMVEVGSSSRDIRLSGGISVTGIREIPIHYTRTSTIGDLLKSAKGRAFMEQMMQKLHGSEEAKKAEADNLNNMGEGSERMVQTMMMEMPLGAIVTFGRMTDEQLDGLIAMLNS